MNRTRIPACVLLALGCWLSVLTAPLLADEKDDAPHTTRTFTYKTVGDLPIQLEAFLPEQQGDELRPLVVQIHGGALIMGSRQLKPDPLINALLKRNCVVASIDYRLAPETKLPEIIADVEDAFAWLRSPSAEELRIDPDRVAVTGGSAGGYLTLMTGYRVNPRPKALVAFWGYGDLIGPWYSQPSPHARHQKPGLTEELARAQVNGPPVSDSRQRKGNAGLFYLYCRQNGLWPKEIAGWDPHTEADQFTPYMPVKNVTADYPPTLLIHGTRDTDVPFEQSLLMEEQLKQHGVDYRLIPVQDAEHGLFGADRKIIEDANQAAVEFMYSRLAAP